MVECGMYGLLQAGSLGHLLKSWLDKEGYFQSQIVPGLWKHKTSNIQFVLLVDDFDIKYIKMEDLDHLIKSFEQYYDVTVDLDTRRSPLSMIPYLQKALPQFNNIVPTKQEDSPYPHVEPKYGAKQQFAEYDTSKPVGKEEQTYVQKVTGKFNWYPRGVDGTMLTPISALMSQQAKPTQAMKRVQQFLDYAATQDPAILNYHKSDMTLAIHSNASYLNEKNAGRRAGGHHFLS
ncbi:hypothetical protein ACHAW6_015473 [Cyclotella cf. meneghiniana]